MKLAVVIALVAAVFAAAPKQLWNYTTANCVASTVAVGGGMAVTGTDGSRLIALDAKTGALRWAYGASMWVQNNPVIIGNLVVFPNNRGNLDAVDINNGTLVWRVTGGEEYNGQAVLVGKVGNTPAVFIGSMSGLFKAIGLNNGTLLWQTSVGGEVFASAAWIDSEQTKLVFGTYSGTVVCLDSQTGKQVWMTAVSGGLFTPRVAQGKIYIGSQEPGAQYILDATTGKLLWSNVNIPAVVGQPEADSERIYWTLNNGTVLATDFMGKSLWSYTIGGSQLNSAPIRHGDTLFVGGYNGLYAINPADGTLQWRFQANGYAAQLGAPTIVGGVAYFGTCLGLPAGVYAVEFGTFVEEWLCDDASCSHGCSIADVPLGCQQTSVMSSVLRAASATELTVTQYTSSATCDPSTPSFTTAYTPNVCNIIASGGSFVWAPSH